MTLPASVRLQSQPHRSVLSTVVSFIEHKNLRFLILDCPTDSNIHLYLKEFRNFNVTHVVRVCEPTYRTEALTSAGIQVHDWPFPDGGIPPASLVKEWVSLVNSCANFSSSVPETIAIHCVAGLGRAPVLVAVALIEHGMEALSAVEYIRKKRRGAFNNRQIQYLDSYKKTKPSMGFKISFNKMFKFSKKIEVS
ncbi:phosphatases II [Basidiobolus meristosporus CBS 931.73]|uniref:protein-tyrosine-phosphatase n=1 Tax=Basidiobolus meristosporus CBS 931.73 TaxID=1314790 RepID=A0A1Y1XAM8_9FUNG|nr:phosphatases II [Basidiobolus meristosporus CBS 931.73]|eukprot:ORX82798.1 phosphatases II [Basidiobolus meristosporus CBS 931.73]